MSAQEDLNSFVLDESQFPLAFQFHFSSRYASLSITNCRESEIARPNWFKLIPCWFWKLALVWELVYYQQSHRQKTRYEYQRVVRRWSGSKWPSAWLWPRSRRSKSCIILAISWDVGVAAKSNFCCSKISQFIAEELIPWCEVSRASSKHTYRRRSLQAVNVGKFWWLNWPYFQYPNCELITNIN